MTDEIPGPFKAKATCASCGREWIAPVAAQSPDTLDEIESLRVTIVGLREQLRAALSRSEAPVAGEHRARQDALEEAASALNPATVEALSARDIFLKVLRRYGGEPYTHVAIDAAWNEAARASNADTSTVQASAWRVWWVSLNTSRTKLFEDYSEASRFAVENGGCVIPLYTDAVSQTVPTCSHPAVHYGPAKEARWGKVPTQICDHCGAWCIVRHAPGPWRTDEPVSQTERGE